MQWMFSTGNEATGATHNCEQRAKRDELLDILPGTTVGARLARFIRRRLIVSERNKRSRIYLKSKSAIDYERSRHLRNNYHMIHPFSEFRMVWEILMVLLIFISLTIIPFIVAFYPTDNSTNPLEVIAAVINLFCIADIVLNFYTGVLLQETNEVHLSPAFVRKTYLKGLFFLDLIAAIPIFIFKLIITPTSTNQEIDTNETRVDDSPPDTPWLHILTFCIFLRIFRLRRYYQHACELLRVSFIVQKFTVLVLTLLVYIHWAGCVCYFVMFYFKSETDGKRVSWMSKIGTQDCYTNYVLSLLHSTSITFVSSLGEYKPCSNLDQVMTIILLLIGRVLIYYVTAKVMHLTKTSQASYPKYREMTSQLQQYMRHKELPTQLQKKVVTYYDYRFQKSYFVETEIMNSLSGQLRQDIVLHSCKHLVEKVPFFTNLPFVLVVRIVAGMRSVYALSNDVILKVGDRANSMYFIKSGTVAIYQSSGKEICHLEDGNHFGEIALLLDVVTRVASVVAVESCELYRLDRNDFQRAMIHHPAMFDRMRLTADRRLKKLDDTGLQ